MLDVDESDPTIDDAAVSPIRWLRTHVSRLQHYGLFFCFFRLGNDGVVRPFEAFVSFYFMILFLLGFFCSPFFTFFNSEWEWDKSNKADFYADQI